MLNYVIAFQVTLLFPMAAMSTNSPFKYLKSRFWLCFWENILQIQQIYITIYLPAGIWGTGDAEFKMDKWIQYLFNRIGLIRVFQPFTFHLCYIV